MKGIYVLFTNFRDILAINYNTTKFFNLPNQLLETQNIKTKIVQLHAHKLRGTY
jgi:hypothetical protein